MATAALGMDGAAPVVARIPLDLIDSGGRLRPVDGAWAAALAAIIRHDGQLMPIEVCQLPGRDGFRLVTGAHRLAALRLNGAAHALAIVVSADRAERRLREVSENLFRRDLAPVDRASFVAELIELARARDGVAGHVPGRAVSANVRWQKALQNEADDAKLTMSLAYGWTEEVAERIGVSVATVKRDLLLHRRLTPAVEQLLRGHPIMGNAAQLRALAKLEPAQQRDVADMIVSGAARSVADAIAVRSQKVRPTAEAKRLSTLIGTLARMGRAEREAAFDVLASDYVNDMRRALARLSDSEGDADTALDENQAAHDARREETKRRLGLTRRKAA